MKPWTPEVEVTIETAKSLIESQFPELSPVEIKYFDSGWDNVVYLVNQQWYFRFPQRKIAVNGVVLEMNCLPEIQRKIIQAPTVQFRGVAEGDYPYPFFGYSPLIGKEACEVDLTPSDRAQVAKDLGRLLAQLHSTELYRSLQPQLPFDPLNRLNFQIKVPQTEGRLEELKKMKVDLPFGSLSKILRAAPETPRLKASAVVHGDLHFRHLIISSDKKLNGLIDWGDLHANDPAVDLQLYWTFFQPSARSVFLSSYGSIDDIQFIQARAFGVFVNVALLCYSLDTGKESIQKEALQALKNSLVD